MFTIIKTLLVVAVVGCNIKYNYKRKYINGYTTSFVAFPKKKKDFVVSLLD